uniref:Uncharacterized protein n=1 Tax=Caenorhabditis japonica TaxID=281687 RepID=A0A8R1DZG6_CAEJA
MNPETAQILEHLLSKNRPQQPVVKLSKTQAAEIAHVAVELQFKNLLNLMQNSLLEQQSTSMQEAVDSLTFALRFGMSEAAGKLIDEVVFGFMDDELFAYCKSEKAMEMILNRSVLNPITLLILFFRKSALCADQEVAIPPSPVFDIPPDSYPIALPANNRQPRKLISDAAKLKARVILDSSLNSLKNGFAWVLSRRVAIRRRQPAREQPERQNFQFL